MLISQNFRNSHTILGESRIIRDDVRYKTSDFVDTNNDGEVHDYYADFRAERGDEPNLSLPYAKIDEYAAHTGDTIVTQNEFDQLQVGTLFVHRDYEKLENPKPVESLLSRVAPFASAEQKAEAKWAIDTESKSLLFYTDQAPSEPVPRNSYDFRCENTILGESKIFHNRMYRGWSADLIDIDGDGKTGERDAGFRLTRTTEPTLSAPLAKIQEKAQAEGKEILLDSELEGLQVGELLMARNYKELQNSRDVSELLGQVAPLATDEQLEKARWAVDVSNGTLLFYTEDVPPADQWPSLPVAEPEPEAPADPAPAPPVATEPVQSASPSPLKTAMASVAGVVGMVAGAVFSCSLAGPLLAGAVQAAQTDKSFGAAVADQFAAPVRWAAHLHDQVEG